MDYFMDLTKPGISVTFNHIKPILVSIALPRPILSKKRPIAKDWFIKPLAKSYVPSVGPIP